MITAWSPSRLSTFEQCPKKAYFEYVRKLKSPSGAAAVEGSRIHELAAQYLTGALPELPSELNVFADEFRALRSSGRELHCEQQHAFTSAMKSTGWFDKDVWLRVVFDVLYSDGKTLVIIDHKTGKVRDKDLAQLELYAHTGFVLHPTVEEVVTRLWYLKDSIGIEYEVIYKREEMPRLWDSWVERAAVMLTETQFPARTSPLCRWCHFTSHHEDEVNARYTREGIAARVQPICEEG